MEGNRRRERISTLFHVARWLERDGGCHLRTRRAGKPPVASSPDINEMGLSHRSTATKIIPITRVVCDIDVTKLKIESCQEFLGSTIEETQRHDNGVIRKDAQRVQANRNSLESSLEPCSRRGIAVVQAGSAIPAMTEYAPSERAPRDRRIRLSLPTASKARRACFSEGARGAAS